MGLIPSVSLQALTLISPSVVGSALSVDSGAIPVVIDADLLTKFVDITLEGSTRTLSNPTIVSGKNRFSGTIQFYSMGETVSVQMVGRNFDPGNPTDPNSQSPKLTPTFILQVLYTSFDNSHARVSPPSGVTVNRRLSTCQVLWTTPTDPGFLGVRVQWSTDPTGISTPYTQQGELVTRVVQSDLATITAYKEVQVSSDKRSRVTKTTENTLLVNFSACEFSNNEVGLANEFYVILSTVAQDADSGQVYESAYSGPFKAGFVDLRKSSPADYPYLQGREDIAGRMISEMLKIYPDLDLTPRSEIRDIYVDPVSIEISEMSTREWFARCSNSISALSQIDDWDGDGFSDPASSSPIKQQLARAWHLNSSDIQSLIDYQFDLLGEPVGLQRGGPQAATVTLYICTYNKPTGRIPVEGILAATIPDQQTPAVQFESTGSAIIDSTNADSFFDPVNGWWFVSLPAQCTTQGSIGNVGAQTIRQGISGVPQGFFVTNLNPSDYGLDSETNARYAERIADKYVKGVDPGSRDGYLTTARSTPGVTQARVVASGDLEMLRDWDPIRRKHIFGTVDIYVRGLDTSQEVSHFPYAYSNTGTPGLVDTYQTLSIGQDKGICSLQLATPPDLPISQVLEIAVSRGTNRLYFGVGNSVVNDTQGIIYLDPKEKAYVISGDSYTSQRYPLQIGSSPSASNAQLFSYLQGPSGAGYLVQGNFRLASPVAHTPIYQPVISVGSLSGEDTLSGILNPSLVRLIKKQDPLLEGGSNRSDDEVRFDTGSTTRMTKSIQFQTGGLVTIPVDKGMVFGVDSSGNLISNLAVRSLDSTTLYVYNTDFTLSKSGPYGEYSISLTQGSSIPLDTLVLVSYDKLNLYERLIYVQDEGVSLQGTLSTSLAHSGFIKNIWLPESYEDFTLSMDGFNSDPSLVSGLYGALVPKDLRYIKVTYNGQVMKESTDFTLSVDSNGVASLARILSGHIPDGSMVNVSYFRNEVFSLSTLYPGYVQQLSTKIASSRNAAADVLIKSMTQNAVDVSLTVEIDSTATPSLVDPKIRTAIALVMDQCKGKLTQSEIIRQVKSIPGVSNVLVPMTKFSKSDGAYDIGLIIPTGTAWVPLNSDSTITSKVTSFPSSTFISSQPLLPNSTLPSGGLKDSYVGLLFEGQPFTRLYSLQELNQANSASFYIIGINDTLDGIVPLDSSYMGKIIVSLPDFMVNPSAYSFRVTYQVWAEGGYKDVLLSPSEYLKPGRVVVDYVLTKKSVNIS